jgi:hypothetical protein
LTCSSQTRKEESWVSSDIAKSLKNYHLAWIEGTAILIAVMLVAGVGSFVDWRKEVAFLVVKLKQMEKNVVSYTLDIAILTSLLYLFR